MKENRNQQQPNEENRLPELKSRRISHSYIEEIKRRHVLESLLYRPPEAAAILGVGVRKIYQLVEDGYLVAANENGAKSKGLRITALSIEEHSDKIRIDPDKWSE